MFKTLANAFKIKEVRKKLIVVLLLLIVYRLGCYIPIPGLDTDALRTAIEGQEFLNLLSSVSGGALASGAFLALGVQPYIMSTIIIQLLTVAIPSLQNLAQEGEAGKRKIALYTKITALVFATAQAIGLVVGLNVVDNITVFNGMAEWVTIAFVVLILVAGSMFTVWLGEKITDQGLGHGVSLLIFVGLLSTATQALVGNFESAFQGNSEAIWQLILFALVLVLIFASIVTVDLAERKVPVQYAKQIKGRKMYGGQSTVIPIRVNSSGVMPIIFAMAIITFPQVLFSIFWPNSTSGFISWYTEYLGTSSWVYFIVLSILILFFSYFYNMISFNTDDIAKQIQQNGGFIPGIRPGKPTSQHLSSISKRIVLFGAIFLALIAVLPSLLFMAIGSSGLTSAFSATGLLICVSVALEFDKQLDAQLMMKNYRGFLK